MATASTHAKLAQKLSIMASSWSLSTHPKLTVQAVQAAGALRDSDMQKKYRLSKKMLQPASMPLHYDRLVEGFDKSAKGIGRPWWKVFFGVW